MNRIAKVLLWIVAGLAVTVAARAVTHDTGHYESIAVRNVFNLQPPIKPEVIKPVATPPPTIELQGISTISGKKALFKVKAAKPGKQDQTYILSEGQRKDEIEVKLIDEKAGSVLFDNHGTLQTLTMAENASKPVKASVALTVSGRMPPPPPVPRKASTSR